MKQLTFIITTLGFAILIGLIISGPMTFSKKTATQEPQGQSEVVLETPPDTKEEPAPAVKLGPRDGVNKPVSITLGVSACRKTPDFAKCMNTFFRAYLKKNTTLATLREIDTLQRGDSDIRLMCHEIIHAIGRETFAKEKTIPASFAACDQTCHSACYHGAMERFLRGDDASIPAEERGHLSEKEIEDKITTACSADGPINLRFQCLHGLGHAAVFYFDYNLIKALASCDRLGSQWDRGSCWGGGFMENVHAQYPEKRYLSKTDFHFPCSVLDEKYKSDCYVMQTTRMAEMGLSKDKIVDECKTAGQYRLSCLQSLGRDSSNDVRLGNGKQIALLCEKVGDEDGKNACMRGAVYALADNTWDGRYVFPFCRDFASEFDRGYCFRAGANYLQSMLLTAKEKLRANCAAFVGGDALCLAAIGSF